MKDTFLIGGLCVAIVLIGAGLYFYEPVEEEGGGYLPLAEGQYAAGIDMERNYRIRSEEDMQSLWALIHGDVRPPLPQVDFSSSEVLAVFDGSHATGGYRIRVASVTDSELVRTVHIEHLEPGESCTVPSVRTSPFMLVTVPKMDDGMRLEHSDTTVVEPCP